MYPNNDKGQINAFKKLEKRFKAKDNWPRVIDHLNKEECEQLGIQQFSVTRVGSSKILNAYEFPSPIGFIVLRDFLSLSEQLELTKECLNNLISFLNRASSPNKPIYI